MLVATRSEMMPPSFVSPKCAGPAVARNVMSTSMSLAPEAKRVEREAPLVFHHLLVVRPRPVIARANRAQHRAADVFAAVAVGR